MAVRQFRHNGQTYSAETVKLRPDDEEFACIVFTPHFNHECHPLIDGNTATGLPAYRRFSTENDAFDAAIHAIRSQIPPVSLLRCFMNQLQESVVSNPPGPRRLQLSTIALIDWRALRQSDWEADGWEGEDQDLTSLDRSDDIFLAALQKRLRHVEIADVQVTNVDYMEIMPA